jgi:general secretion pathway protein G
MKRVRGFTLIELLVVMAIIGLLLALALPRYFQSVDRARETALRHDLAVMREAIDKYRADRGQYPENLDALSGLGYVRAVPVDPLTERADTWQLIAAPEPESGVADVRSGAPGTGSDGSAYADW